MPRCSDVACRWPPWWRGASGLAQVVATVGSRAGARRSSRRRPRAGACRTSRRRPRAGARVSTAPPCPVPLLRPRLLHAAPPLHLLHASPPRVLRRCRLGISPARIRSSLERIGAGRRQTGAGRRRAGSKLGGLPPQRGLRCAAVAWARRGGELQLHWLSAEHGRRRPPPFRVRRWRAFPSFRPRFPYSRSSGVAARAAAERGAGAASGGAVQRRRGAGGGWPRPVAAGTRGSASRRPLVAGSTATIFFPMTWHADVAPFCARILV